MSPAEWIDFGVIPITNPSKDASLQAVGFEISNSSFYKMCALKAETKINAAIYDRLADQEGEHADLICKMLGIEVPKEKSEDVPDKDREKFIQAHAKELRAVLHYQHILAIAPEMRVREVFAALTDVENEHLKITNYYR